NAGSIIEQLKSFLNTDACLTGERKHQNQAAHEKNRIHRSLESRMQSREPRGKKSVPACNHWQARITGKNQCHRAELPQKQQNDEHWHDPFGNTQPVKSNRERLRNWTDE